MRLIPSELNVDLSFTPSGKKLSCCVRVYLSGLVILHRLTHLIRVESVSERSYFETLLIVSIADIIYDHSNM